CHQSHVSSRNSMCSSALNTQHREIWEQDHGAPAHCAHGIQVVKQRPEKVPGPIFRHIQRY
ncbi:MAG: hypothetical protein ACOCVE_04775, partial [Desulfovermiculus sp.]